MAAASKADLARLHRLFAAYLTEIVEQAGEGGEDALPLDAATMGVVSKFLKDNDITCDPADREDLEALREQFSSKSKTQRVSAAIARAKADDEPQVH